MREQRGIQAPVFNGDLGDLESFQACKEEIRTCISQVNPSLYEVLGEIASSKQPIGEGDILQASQRIMKEEHRALRVIQAKMARASFTEETAHQLQPNDEYKTTEADKLQTRSAERQLGCLLVMKIKEGEPSFKSADGFQQPRAGKLGGNSTCSTQASGVTTLSF